MSLASEITRRDLFAAHALPYALERAKAATQNELVAMFGRDTCNIRREQIAAKFAYDVADSMLAMQDYKKPSGRHDW